jgi:hypothetical protein
MEPNKEKLLKADGVRDCVKWIEKKIKKEQKTFESMKQTYLPMTIYDDCGDFYREEIVKQEGAIKTLIQIKVELDKYRRKLRWEAYEEFRSDEGEI